jgi:hypothetical protein
MVHGAIQRFAGRRGVPVGLLEQLLADLPPLFNETNSYARVLRVEFTYYAYPSLDLKKLTEAWSSVSETNAAMQLYPEEFRRPWKILLDPLLVSQHPRPLDEAVEIQRAASHYRTYLSNALSAWEDRSDAIADETEELQEKLLEDIKPLMELTKDEPLPLSRQAAQKARSLYLEIQNPVGRILQCGLAEFIGNDERVFRSRTEREATRALLGLLIFERKKGVLPPSLETLVEEKILPSLPFDHFADAPLNYSRERRRIWSVGEDAVDDDGEGDPQARWSGDDAVWEIPEPEKRL